MLLDLDRDPVHLLVWHPPCWFGAEVAEHQRPFALSWLPSLARDDVEVKVSEAFSLRILHDVGLGAPGGPPERGGE